MNSRFIKKIPPGAEVANLLVGEVEELNRRVAAFVRLGVRPSFESRHEKINKVVTEQVRHEPSCTRAAGNFGFTK